MWNVCVYECVYRFFFLLFLFRHVVEYENLTRCVYRAYPVRIPCVSRAYPTAVTSIVTAGFVCVFPRP